MRLDRALVRRGLVPSRQRAKEAITAGQVFVDGQQITKASWRTSGDAVVRISGPVLVYPSRAGLKLEKALDHFRISVEGIVALDVGAAAGGFTSCLLQRGARLVYAVDVGRDQLAAELRDDPRVIVMQDTDIRTVTGNDLLTLPSLAVVDVSFISLRKVFPALLPLLPQGGQVVALIKPQFETGGRGLSKHGVIRDKGTHVQFIPPLLDDLQGVGFRLEDFSFSPIAGTKGNLEFLAHFTAHAQGADVGAAITATILTAWELVER